MRQWKKDYFVICLQYYWFHSPALPLHNTAPLQLLWSCRYASLIIKQSSSLRADFLCHQLEDPGHACALGSFHSWCQVSGLWWPPWLWWHSEGLTLYISLFVPEPRPLTPVWAGQLLLSVRKGCCQVVFPQLTQDYLGHSYFLSSFKSFVGLYL